MNARLSAAAFRRVLIHARGTLIGRTNVVGVSTGLRRRRPAQTLDEECVTVFVRRKLYPSQLAARHRIPSYFCGRHKDGTVDRTVRVYTDVVQMSHGHSLAGAPRRGGDGLYLQRKAGTSTLAFRHGAELHLLSNRHVFVPRLHGEGDRGVRLDSAADAAVAADATIFIPLAEEGGSSFRDAALASVRPGQRRRFRVRTIRGLSDEALRVIDTRPVRSRETRRLRLSGFRSRFRSGPLWDRLSGGGSWIVEYPHLGTRVVDGLYGLLARTRQGDSGAPIYLQQDEGAVLVGIVVAVAHDEETGERITLFHSITDVEKRLGEVIGDPQFTLLES